MRDSGSPITIFTQTDLRQVLIVDVIFARPMPNNETCRLQQQTAKVGGIRQCGRPSDEKKNKKCTHWLNKRWEKITQRKRLAHTTEVSKRRCTNK